MCCCLFCWLFQIIKRRSNDFSAHTKKANELSALEIVGAHPLFWHTSFETCFRSVCDHPLSCDCLFLINCPHGWCFFIDVWWSFFSRGALTLSSFFVWFSSGASTRGLVVSFFRVEHQHLAWCWYFVAWEALNIWFYFWCFCLMCRGIKFDFQGSWHDTKSAPSGPTG